MTVDTKRPAARSPRASRQKPAVPLAPRSGTAPATTDADPSADEHSPSVAGDPVETRIYRAVFDSVMNQRLTPGTKLPEAALCEAFGASRTHVRQALQRLAHEHIVQLRPNRGAIVAVPTPEDMRQIFEARRALEAALVRLAVTRATAADLAALRKQLQQEHQALHRTDQPGWMRVASGFHLQIAALARNPILQRHLQETVSRCSLIVALYEPPGNAACEHDEHGRIVDCIESGDADAAVALMDSHLLALERRIDLRRDSPQRSLKQLLGLAV